MDDLTGLEALTGPGAPFEIVEEEVLGEPMQVFRNRPRSVRQLLVESAARGEDEYVVHGARRLSFEDHFERVIALAAVLRDELDVGKGDRVAILAANCPEWIMMFWAAVSNGSIVASLNSFWSEVEIADALASCEPEVVLVDRDRAAKLPRPDSPTPYRVVEIGPAFDALVAAGRGAAPPEEPIDEDDPAVILYTSGTTGRSKGAVASHRSICGAVTLSRFSAARAAAASAAAGAGGGVPAVGSKQVSLVTLPLFHASGLYGFVVGQLATGGSVVLRSGRFEEDDVIRLIDRERVTMWAALGSMGPRVAARAGDVDCDLSSLRLLAVGGAPVSPAVQDLLRESFPNASLNISMGYTSSEGIAVVTRNQGQELREHPTSVGRPMITTEVEVRSPLGERVADGETGAIHVRSPYIMSEYWRDPEATARTIKPGRWLDMGDLGHFEDGRLYLDSRADDMMLVNAENVYPVEIEHRLDAHPAVSESAVFGVDDDLTGQAIRAVVAIRPEASISRSDLAEWCRAAMPAYKVPTHWDLRSQPLPRNATGKILKRVLAVTPQDSSS